MSYNHEEYIRKNKQSSNNWRLPTVEELMLMFNRDNGNPNIKGFNPSGYWSSTTYEGVENSAWIVDLCFGDVCDSLKENNLDVRCVRDTETGLEWHKDSKVMNWYEAIEYAKNLI